MNPGVAAVLRRAGFGLSALWFGMFAVFLTGETLDDPGGLRGVALVLAWLLPVTLAVALARYRPAPATIVFTALTAAIVAVNLWFAADSAGWRSFEHQHGPLRAIAIFVLAAGLAVLGLRRTLTAGCLLLAVGIVPIVVSSHAHGGLSSIMAAASVPTITGALYVASAVAQYRRRRPDGVRKSTVRSPVHAERPVTRDLGR